MSNLGTIARSGSKVSPPLPFPQVLQLFPLSGSRVSPRRAVLTREGRSQMLWTPASEECPQARACWHWGPFITGFHCVITGTSEALSVICWMESVLCP